MILRARDREVNTMTQEQQGYTLTEAAIRYRETMMFNNELLKRNYPDWYEFNTKMQADKKRHFGSNEASITKYEERRRKEYDKKFEDYRKRLDAQVDESVNRYMRNIKAAFGYGVM